MARKRGRASWVFIEAYRVVVISAYDYRRLLAYEVDDLRGIWPIVHQVAQNPKLIEVGRQRADGLKIGVKIRNDKHSHRFYPAVTAVSLDIIAAFLSCCYSRIRRWSSPNRRSPSGQ